MRSSGRQAAGLLRHGALASLGLMALGFLVAAPSPGWPHQIRTSYTTLTVTPDRVTVAVVIDESDLLKGVGIDPDGNGALTREEMEPSIPVVLAFVEGKLGVWIDGAALPLRRTQGGVQGDSKGNLFVSTEFQAGLAEAPGQVELDLAFVPVLGADHTSLVQIFLPGQPQQRAVFAPGNTRQTFVLPGGEDSLFGRVVEAVRRWVQ